MCRREELQPGAYFSDSTTRKLYELQYQVNNVVKLADAGRPIDDPAITSLLVPQALKRLELVRAAPCLDDLATVDEWGEAG